MGLILSRPSFFTFVLLEKCEEECGVKVVEGFVFAFFLLFFFIIFWWCLSVDTRSGSGLFFLDGCKGGACIVIC